MDEDTQVQAENAPVVEDNNPTVSPTDEPTTSDSVQEEGQAEQEQVDAPAPEETKEDSERKPTRAERRIRELNAKIKELESPNQVSPGVVQSPQLSPDEAGEITPEQLDQFVAQRADQVADQKVNFAIAQERAKANFEADTKTLPQEYPEIESVPGLEEKIAQEFQDKAFKVVGVDPVTGKARYALDPSVRLADIAKNYVDVARAAAKQSSAATQTAVAETADTAAIKPSGETRQEKPLSEMSIEELEAKVGFYNG